mmetsp:Transcript_7299/g.21496  ORF Transcript_7299/g.21496 Transcript_7299/m.21496 type:complete len:213 (+) Transcript_7299:2667-3305(+)
MGLEKGGGHIRLHAHAVHLRGRRPVLRRRQLPRPSVRLNQRRVRHRVQLQPLVLNVSHQPRDLCKPSLLRVALQQDVVSLDVGRQAGSTHAAHNPLRCRQVTRLHAYVHSYAVCSSVQDEVRCTELSPQAAPTAQQRRLLTLCHGADRSAVHDEIRRVARRLKGPEDRQHPLMLLCLRCHSQSRLVCVHAERNLSVLALPPDRPSTVKALRL